MLCLVKLLYLQIPGTTVQGGDPTSTFVHFCPHHIENPKVDKNKSGQKWTKVDKSRQKWTKADLNVTKNANYYSKTAFLSPK